jgi:pyruvate/2-oxoglutarate/acetoin dehydrogenase E1 component
MRTELREIIKTIVEKHLKKGYIALGQCLTAVGWVGGTLPEMYEADGMVELSMADVAGGGFVVGSALAGKRPIYIIRYQGFNWFNAPIIINYAAKSKELWGRPCPIFIRSIAMEGAIGPVAGSSHASLYYRMPGVVIASPMSGNEYTKVYDKFMQSDDVYYVSEHRGSYGNTSDLETINYSESDIVILAISITRFNAIEASRILKQDGIKVSVHHLFWIKPLQISDEFITAVRNSKCGFIVLDDDYVDGIANSIAYEIMVQTRNPNGYTLGLKNKSAGFSKETDNLPPSTNEIIDKIKTIISKD